MLELQVSGHLKVSAKNHLMLVCSYTSTRRGVGAGEPN